MNTAQKIAVLEQLLERVRHNRRPSPALRAVPEPSPTPVVHAAEPDGAELTPVVIRPALIESPNVGEFIGEVQPTRAPSFGDLMAAALRMSFER